MILGTVFRAVTQDPRLADQIHHLFGDFETTTRPARSGHILQITGARHEPHTLYRSCYRRASEEGCDDLLPTLVALVNQEAIAATRWFAAHAAVVAIDERIIAFPAESGGGKTTLAAAAVLDGFEYLSDEALVIDDDSHAVPYPKPMALSPWSCQRLGLEAASDERLLTPVDLGGKTRMESGDLTDIVITSYGAEKDQLEELPPSRAVAELIGKSFNHYKNPERAFRLSTEVARRARVWRLEYDDPKAAIDLLAESLAAE